MMQTKIIFSTHIMVSFCGAFLDMFVQVDSCSVYSLICVMVLGRGSGSWAGVECRRTVPPGFTRKSSSN